MASIGRDISSRPFFRSSVSFVSSVRGDPCAAFNARSAYACADKNRLLSYVSVNETRVNRRVLRDSLCIVTTERGLRRESRDADAHTW